MEVKTHLLLQLNLVIINPPKKILLYKEFIIITDLWIEISDRDTLALLHHVQVFRALMECLDC